jgi:hypothetical protein
MALFYECMLKCAQKLLDTADIVREAMFRQLSTQQLKTTASFLDCVEHTLTHYQI